MTSITGQNPQMFNLGVMNQQNPQYPAQVAGQRQVFPNGVTYTFSPQAQNYALRNFTDMNACYNGNDPSANHAHQHQPLSLEQQIALNQLQKHGLESLLLHEQFRENPFKLQFHKDGQTNTESMYKDFCKCTSRNTQLQTLQHRNTIPTNGLKPPNPEQLFSDSVKRKQLRIKPSPDFEDKCIQFSPMQQSIDTQIDTIVSCMCNEKESTTTDNQTETKKVTFDETDSPKGKPISKRRGKPTRRARLVDEDSSDSSLEESTSSSKSSGE